MSSVKCRIPIILLAATLLAAAPASARTYKWVDADGTTHYSQSMPADATVRVIVVEIETSPVPATEECLDLRCRLARLQSQRAKNARDEDAQRAASGKTAPSYPVWPTPVAETDDEKITRLVAECKRSRGSDCESDREKRRMLLNNVELTHAERRALRALSPRLQRRVLLQRIPKRYRDID